MDCGVPLRDCDGAAPVGADAVGGEKYVIGYCVMPGIGIGDARVAAFGSGAPASMCGCGCGIDAGIMPCT